MHFGVAASSFKLKFRYYLVLSNIVGSVAIGEIFRKKSMNPVSDDISVIYCVNCTSLIAKLHLPAREVLHNLTPEI